MGFGRRGWSELTARLPFQCLWWGMYKFVQVEAGAELFGVRGTCPHPGKSGQRGQLPTGWTGTIPSPGRERLIVGSA